VIGKMFMFMGKLNGRILKRNGRSKSAWKDIPNGMKYLGYF
jgi:hypothetical protein